MVRWGSPIARRLSETAGTGAVQLCVTTAPAGGVNLTTGLLSGTPTIAGTSVHDTWNGRERVFRGAVLYDRHCRRAAAAAGVPDDHAVPTDIAQWHSGSGLQPDDRGKWRQCAVQLWRDGRRPAGRCDAHRGRPAGGNADDGRQFDSHGRAGPTSTPPAVAATLSYTIVMARPLRNRPPAVCPTITPSAADVATRRSGEGRYKPEIVGSGGTGRQLWRDTGALRGCYAPAGGS